MSTFTIGQVARRAGVGVETVRFYEREGLLEEPPRRASSCRRTRQNRRHDGISHNGGHLCEPRGPAFKEFD